MNERIRELAEQAEHNTRKDHNNLYWRLQNEIAEDETFLKKFAEMILKECLTLFENAKVNQEDDVDYGLEEAKNIIKEHFGVEE